MDKNQRIRTLNIASVTILSASVWAFFGFPLAIIYFGTWSLFLGVMSYYFDEEE